MSKYTAYAIAALITLIATYSLGYTKGKHSAEKDYTRLQLKQLQAVIDHSQRLTEQAQAASLKLEKVITQAQEANLNTTRDIKNALSTTKHLRVNCTFDDSVMQQLDAARRRAAAATTTADPSQLLPTTRGNDR